MNTAIVGAGLAGLVCARALIARGHSVVVFDKGRAPGGRMCSARRGPGGHADHGARSFIVHDARFARQVRDWTDRGLVAAWDPRLVSIDAPGEIRELVRGPQRYVGTPAMHAPVRDLAAALGPRARFHQGERVTSLHRSGSGWIVRTEDGGTETVDAVAIAVPAPQAAPLLAEIPHLNAIASAVPMAPCWSVTASFAAPLPVAFDAANCLIGGRHRHAGVLAWADRESSKPGRAHDECWVLQAGDEWSREHIEAEPEQVGRALLAAFFDAVGIDPAEPTELATHRWRYAFPVAPLCDGCLFDEELLVGACGDWCMGSRVEGAFLSGLAMAGRLLGERTDFLEPCLTTPRKA